MLYPKIAQRVISHVVPTKHNGFIPHLLKAPAMWAMLGSIVALFSFSQLLRITEYLNTKAEVYPASIVTLANQDRNTVGLSALSVSPTLQAAARLKVQDMVTENYFAHTSPQGVTPWHWFKEAGYSFVYAGENLAVNFADSGDVEKAWIDSPTHRANIMNGNFTEIGIAIANGVYQGQPTTYVVELFGMPAIPKKNVVAFKPTSASTISLSVPSPKIADAATTVGTVAGESTQAEEGGLQLVDNTQNFVSVKNSDPTIEQKIITQPVTPHIPWFKKILLQTDNYIGILIEIIVVALVMAMATLVTHERQVHHRMHMAYGILMTIILASSLFVGRMGVFAEARSFPLYLTSQF
jgi:uncharacterized protein YkwD